MTFKISKFQKDEWLNLLCSNITLGAVILNQEGNVLGINDAILTIWGYTSPEEYPEKIEGINITNFINPLKPIHELLRQVRALGHIEVCKFPYITHKKEVKWAKLEGWVLKEDEDIVISGWIWIDITPACRESNEELLEIMKDTLNLIFQDMDYLYFLWEINEDLTTRILDINKEVEKVLSYSSFEILGKDFLQCVIPEAWRIPISKYIQEVSRNPKPYFGEYPLLAKTGEEISIRWLAVPIELKIFNKVWVVSVGENIQEKMQKELELRGREERYRRMLEAVTDYFYHVRIDNGRVVETIHSPGCESVTGYTPQEFRENQNLWYLMVHDEDKDKVLNFANALIRGEVQGPLLHRICRKDGQIRWVKNTPSLIYNKEGKLIGYDSLIRDVTGEVIAQEALEKSELRYRSIIENLAEGYFEIDFEGYIRFANTPFVKIFGKDNLHSILNKKFGDFLELEENSKLLSLLEKARHEKKKIDIYMLKIKLNGHDTEKIVDCSFIPILNHKKEVIGFSGTIRDITERIKQEGQLRQLQKWEGLGALVGGIAHNFNNLLMIIQGHLDLEKVDFQRLTGSVIPELAIHHIEIQEALDRASDLCKQMMIYAGKGFTINKKWKELNTIIKEMLPLLEVAVHSKITLTTVLCKENTGIQCDEILIRQVILSLVTNSVEAIGDRAGQINICTHVVDFRQEMFSSFVVNSIDLQEGKYVELIIEDNGEGIDPKNLEKLFDPFYTTKFLGRGLGLPTVLGIVRIHYGGMKIESEPGKGTKVYVIFPIAPLDTSSMTLSTEETKEDKEIARKVILIVEDDSIQQNLMKKILASKGFDIMTVNDGIEAMEAISSSQYIVKLIILDLGLPRMSGKEFLSEMVRKGLKIPVILCSGLPMEEIAYEYKDLVVDSLRKPCLAKEIISSVEKAWKEHC